MTVRTLEMTTECIVLERSYPAAPWTLYATLLDPERVCVWCALPGETCRVLQWDLQEGGAFLLLLRQHDTGEVRRIEGDFVTLEPPRRIITTFQPVTSERQPDTPRLVAELTPQGPQTLLRLMHARLTGPGAAETAAQQWQTRLERLEAVIPPTERIHPNG